MLISIGKLFSRVSWLASEKITFPHCNSEVLVGFNECTFLIFRSSSLEGEDEAGTGGEATPNIYSDSVEILESPETETTEEQQQTSV